MEITFIGHACFRIKGKDTTVVVDPYQSDKLGYKLPKLTADIVLVSHHHDDHNYAEGVKDYKLFVDTAGEFEMNNTFIYGIQTFHDDKKGELRGKNTIYQIDIDGFSLLHLGDLGHELSEDTLERISDIHVLMIPVGGIYTINSATASKVISSIEPAIVIPMHYQTDDLTGLSEKLDPLSKFLEEMGEENGVRKEEILKLSAMTNIPEETEIVVLKPAH